MSDPAVRAPSEPSALAIICGGGSLPFALADAALRRGRRVVLFALHGWTDPQRVGAYRHYWGRMGEFGDSYGPRPRKAVVTSLSSERWDGRPSGNCAPTCGCCC